LEGCDKGICGEGFLIAEVKKETAMWEALENLSWIKTHPVLPRVFGNSRARRMGLGIAE
jgi:hypothetical protein